MKIREIVMRAKTFTWLLMSTVLYGCSTPVPRYVLPPDVPSADLKSAVAGGYSGIESIEIYATDGGCDSWERKKLFDVHKSKSDPEGYVKVVANQPLKLSYYERASGGRHCKISIEVSLEQGKKYSLIGGFKLKKGPIPILTDTRMCAFGVKDDADDMPVPYKKLCSQ